MCRTSAENPVLLCGGVRAKPRTDFIETASPSPAVSVLLQTVTINTESGALGTPSPSNYPEVSRKNSHVNITRKNWGRGGEWALSCVKAYYKAVRFKTVWQQIKRRVRKNAHQSTYTWNYTVVHLRTTATAREPRARAVTLLSERSALRQTWRVRSVQPTVLPPHSTALCTPRESKSSTRGNDSVDRRGCCHENTAHCFTENGLFWVGRMHFKIIKNCM